MIAVTRRIAMAATAVVALHGAGAAAKDEASFVFTSLEPPQHHGFVYVTGVYQDKAIGYYPPADAYEGFVWSAGNYTLVPAIGTLDAVSDNGLAVGNTPGSATSYTTYDIETGTTKTVAFGPPGGVKFEIGGINASGTIAATQFTTVMKGKPRTACQPFEQDADGSYKWLAESKLSGLGAIGLTNDGVVVMQQSCGQKYLPDYHLSEGGNNKTFAIAGAAHVDISFVAGSSFGGDYNNDVPQYFGFTSTAAKASLITYTPPPGSVAMSVRAIGPHHEVAGYTIDATDHLHGFIYANKTYYAINYPHQKNTIITGFSSTGAIIGYFGSEKDTGGGYPTNPFIATCASDAGCTK